MSIASILSSNEADTFKLCAQGENTNNCFIAFPAHKFLRICASILFSNNQKSHSEVDPPPYHSCLTRLHVENLN